MADQPGRIVVAGLSVVRHGPAVDNLTLHGGAPVRTGLPDPTGRQDDHTSGCCWGWSPRRAAPRRSAGAVQPDLAPDADGFGAVPEASSFPAAAPPGTTSGYAAASGIPDRRADEVMPGRPHRRGQAEGAHLLLGMRQRLGLAFAPLLGTRGCCCWTSRPTASTRRASAPAARLPAGAPTRAAHRAGLSHPLTEVQQSADRVVILSQGRLVREGSVVELEQAPASPSWSVLADARQARQTLAAAGVTATAAARTSCGCRAATRPRSGTRRSRSASSCTSCAPSGPTWQLLPAHRGEFHAQDGRVPPGGVPGAPPGQPGMAPAQHVQTTPGGSR